MGFSQAAHVHFNQFRIKYYYRIDVRSLIIYYAVQAELIMNCCIAKIVWIPLSVSFLFNVVPTSE